MRFLRSLIPSVLVLGAGIAEAASSWNFDEAIISVSGKGAGVGAGFKDKYVALPLTILLICMLRISVCILILYLQIFRPRSSLDTG
jgi:hypothetical protein